MQEKLIFDESNCQIRVHLEGEEYALVRYHKVGDVYHITSTKVPNALQGRGYGKVMMEAILPLFEERKLKIHPVCSYVVHYLERHPEWQHLVA